MPPTPYASCGYAALFDVIEPKYLATATGIMLSVAFIIGSFSPVILGWVKQTIGLSAGIASLGLVYLVSAMIIFAATRFFFDKDYCNG